MDQNVTTQRSQREKKEREKEERKRFAENLYSEARLKELRQKHDKSLLGDSPRLSQGEALELIRQGNFEHVERLDSIGASPQKRYEKLKSGNADYIILACSDSRIPQIDSEQDTLLGFRIRIAGNVVPKEGTPSYEELKDALSMVKQGGVLLIEGHIRCGAVKEKVNLSKSKEKTTHSEHLDHLLHHVEGSTPEENVLAQIKKAKDLLFSMRRPDIKIGGFVYDWDKGRINLIGGERTPEMVMMVDHWLHSHLGAAVEEKGSEALSARLQNQRPHTVAVKSDDLPFSMATIGHSRQNEIFATTGSAHGLDKLDEGSILYAIEHLGTTHVAFIAPDADKDYQKIKKLYDKWEKDLRTVKHGDVDLGKMLDSGKLRISRLVYDLKNGQLKLIE